MGLSHRMAMSLDEIVIVKNIIVIILLYHLCLDIIRMGEPIASKAGAPFFENL